MPMPWLTVNMARSLITALITITFPLLRIWCPGLPSLRGRRVVPRFARRFLGFRLGALTFGLYGIGRRQDGDLDRGDRDQGRAQRDSVDQLHLRASLSFNHSSTGAQSSKRHHPDGVASPLAAPVVAAPGLSTRCPSPKYSPAVSRPSPSL